MNQATVPLSLRTEVEPDVERAVLQDIRVVGDTVRFMFGDKKGELAAVWFPVDMKDMGDKDRWTVDVNPKMTLRRAGRIMRTVPEIMLRGAFKKGAPLNVPRSVVEYIEEQGEKMYLVKYELDKLRYTFLTLQGRQYHLLEGDFDDDELTTLQMYEVFPVLPENLNVVTDGSPLVGVELPTQAEYRQQMADRFLKSKPSFCSMDVSDYLNKSMRVTVAYMMDRLGAVLAQGMGGRPVELPCKLDKVFVDGKHLMFHWKNQDGIDMSTCTRGEQVLDGLTGSVQLDHVWTRLKLTNKKRIERFGEEMTYGSCKIPDFPEFVLQKGTSLISNKREIMDHHLSGEGEGSTLDERLKEVGFDGRFKPRHVDGSFSWLGNNHRPGTGINLSRRG